MSTTVMTLRSSAPQPAGTVVGLIDDGGEIESIDEYSETLFVLDVTAAATEATDTLDVYVDISLDDGSTWINAVHFMQIVGNLPNGMAKHIAQLEYLFGNAVIDITNDAPAGQVRPIGIGTSIRYRGVVADPDGGPASFTYSLQAFFEVN